MRKPFLHPDTTPRHVSVDLPNDTWVQSCFGRDAKGDGTCHAYSIHFDTRASVLALIETCAKVLILFDPSVPIPGVTPEERAAALQPTNDELVDVAMDAWRASEPEPSRRPADLCAPCLEPETAVSTGDRRGDGYPGAVFFPPLDREVSL